MLLLLLSLLVLSVHGLKTDQGDETLRKQVEILTEIVGKLQNELETLKRQDEHIKESVEKLQAENANLKYEIQELRRTKLADPPICFSAVMTSTQDVAAGENIVFDEELVDTHDTYNPTYGIYIIPQAGLYEVIVTFCKPSGDAYNSVGDLYVGDTFLARIQNFDNSSTRTHNSASIIREFQAGDALHVVSRDADPFWGSPNGKSSQFSAKYLGPAPSA